MYKILVCDDDKEIVKAIEIYLQNDGYQVVKAYNGFEALEIIKTDEIHCIIIDVMMPKIDGLSATKFIREEKNIPIIMLSAKSEDYDKVNGLNMGADDYVTKPFSPVELLARVKSQLRRYFMLGSSNIDEDTKHIYKVGGLEVNNKKREVYVDGEKIKLTKIEYNIVLLLIENVGKVFSINEIYEAVWNEKAYSADNTVAVHIRRIREKIEINPKDPKYLKVVWGIGYKISND